MNLPSLSKRLLPLVLICLTIDSQAQNPGKYWLFFADKGPHELQQANLLKAQSALQPRARFRHKKLMPPPRTADETDLPVYAGYIEELQRLGCVIEWPSRWLNAVSARLSPEQLAVVSNLGFVVRVQPVGKRDRSRDPEIRQEDAPGARKSASSMDYGLSFDQNALIQVPSVHERGNNGDGVLIAVFDTGFRLNHECLDHLNVVAAYDFINRDSNVDLDSLQDLNAQISHGTKVLSVLAGHAPGSLIGPAYGASIALAKTEDVSSETAVEEDYYIAALEWADSLGVDIVTSSLSYLDWYTYEDMDGDTAPISTAVDVAVKKGLVVVTAAGNEGMSDWRYISAPADADSVIAVGAVDRRGAIASFSSYGPTFDGRLKPEVTAMGVGNICAQVPGPEGLSTAYTSGSGTSFAAPMAAGAAALLLAEVPELEPMQVRQALMETATQNANPDNRYGCGIVQIDAAIDLARSWTNGCPLPDPAVPDDWQISGYPNPFVSGRQIMRIQVRNALAQSLRIEIYNLLGQKIIRLWDGSHASARSLQVYWDGRDAGGNCVQSGTYFCRVEGAGRLRIFPLTVVR